MSYVKWLKVSQSLLALGIIRSMAPVQAQITPDRSLGIESSSLSGNNITKLIEGGALRGGNLFHSFQEFNVNTGQKVNFSNLEGVVNIFSRITGNNISRIDGVLGVLGSANLFILNPNGIIFGTNASLDVKGSFLATSASSIDFENGFQFSAVSPKIPPL